MIINKVNDMLLRQVMLRFSFIKMGSSKNCISDEEIFFPFSAQK